MAQASVACTPAQLRWAKKRYLAGDDTVQVIATDLNMHVNSFYHFVDVCEWPRRRPRLRDRERGEGSDRPGGAVARLRQIVAKRLERLERQTEKGEDEPLRELVDLTRLVERLERLAAPNSETEHDSHPTTGRSLDELRDELFGRLCAVRDEERAARRARRV